MVYRSYFIETLYNIVNDENNKEYIRWSSNNKNIILLNQDQIGNNLLQKHFKHNNINTLIRQLNKYGFRKVRSNSKNDSNNEEKILEYHHQHFFRGCDDQLSNIIRKPVRMFRGEMGDPNENNEKWQLLFEIQTRTMRIINDLTIKIFDLRVTLNTLLKRQPNFKETTCRVVIYDNGSHIVERAFYAVKDLGLEENLICDLELNTNINAVCISDIIVLCVINNEFIGVIEEVKRINPNIKIVLAVVSFKNSYDQTLHVRFPDVDVVYIGFLKNLIYDLSNLIREKRSRNH